MPTTSMPDSSRTVASGGQPFRYSDLAHIVIPREFFWETGALSSYRNGTWHQDIAALSTELTALGIDHRLTEIVLEVKLY